MKNGHFRITLMKRIKRGSNQTERGGENTENTRILLCIVQIHYIPSTILLTR